MGYRSQSSLGFVVLWFFRRFPTGNSGNNCLEASPSRFSALPSYRNSSLWQPSDFWPFHKPYPLPFLQSPGYRLPPELPLVLKVENRCSVRFFGMTPPHRGLLRHRCSSRALTPFLLAATRLCPLAATPEIPCLTHNTLPLPTQTQVHQSPFPPKPALSSHLLTPHSSKLTLPHLSPQSFKTSPHLLTPVHKISPYQLQ